MTQGAFRLNHATLMNNATLFEGATIETGTAASRMDLVSGTRLELGADSRARFFGDHLVLERGQSVLHKAQGFRVEARGLTILPDDRRVDGRYSVAGEYARPSGGRDGLVPGTEFARAWWWPGFLPGKHW